jgi:sugar phosphate isomerase/epimerase
VKLAYTISASTTRFAAVGQTGDVMGTLRFLAGLGFDGVELAVRDPSLIAVDEIADGARALGVAVPAIGTGQAYVEEGLALTAPEERVRERAVERLLAQLSIASRLGALLIVGLIHGPIPPGEPRARAEERVLSGLGRVAQAARRRGVRLVVEPINRYESNWLNTVDEVIHLLARLGEDNVGVLPDTFHMNIEEPDPLAALAAAAPSVWHVHVADSNRHAPGRGHLDFRRVVDVLRGLGYEGFVSAEILQHPTFEEAARQTIAAMRPLVPPVAR